MATIGMYTADVRDLSLLLGYSNTTLSNTYARTGSYSYSVGYGHNITFMGSGTSTVYAKICMLKPYIDFPFVRFYSSGSSNKQVEITFLQTGINVYRNTTLLGNVVMNLYSLVWYCFEIKVVISDTIGEVIIKVDGVEKINLTSQDTLHDGGGDIVSIEVVGNSKTQTGYIDDIVVDDSAWPGVGGLHVLVPSGAGNYTNWTPSTGSNYACVDENPPSDTDYVSTAAGTPDTKDSYAMGDLAVTAAAIPRIGVLAKAKLDASGSGNLIPFIRSNSTDDDGPTTPLSTSLKWCNGYWDTDPGNGDAAWTDDNVNALEAGVKT